MDAEAQRIQREAEEFRSRLDAEQSASLREAAETIDWLANLGRSWREFQDRRRQEVECQTDDATQERTVTPQKHQNSMSMRPKTRRIREEILAIFEEAGAPLAIQQVFEQLAARDVVPSTWAGHRSTNYHLKVMERDGVIPSDLIANNAVSSVISNGMKKKGYVYFVQGSSGGPIKIGYSVNVAKRLAVLSYPDELILLAQVQGDKALERRLHRRFKKYRAHGEWFNPAPELLAYIDSLKEAVDDD